MAGLTCLTFNCRGWNSGSLTLLNHINSCDLCFLQEHWLFSDQLHKLSNFHVDFSSVSVSGMDSSVLLTGRPFGGCAILFRNLPALHLYVVTLIVFVASDLLILVVFLIC